jgi:2-keto-4-pentenoate hydratase/2-oxohepta-3-ene-1,7-dioic acid hydratase in catechol pathway
MRRNATGCGAMKSGDVVEVAIDGIGVLRIRPRR